MRAKNGTGALLDSVLSFLTGSRSAARRLGVGAGRAMGSADGRWALVSTSLTTCVAVSVTWLSLAAVPASTAQIYAPARENAALPYDFLARFAGVRPLGHASENAPGYRAAGLISAPKIAGPVDRLLAAEPQEAKPVETRELMVDDGDTLMGMLQEAGVSNRDANAVVAAMRPLYSPRSIRSGQVFKATFGSVEAASSANSDAAAERVSATDQQDGNDDDADSRRLLSLSFSPSIERQITVRLNVPDGYLAEDVQRQLEAHYRHVGGTIDSSLYLAATQAGVPANVVVEMIRMFSYDVDFQRDVHDGDSFELFFNQYYTEDGRMAKSGDIMAGAMTLGGKKKLLYRFETADGAEYFDSNGQSAKSMLMKTPVDGARISSTFGARRHPILGYTRMHKGIDFAVPRGTPVMAAGSGTIAFAGKASGYGNFVVIKHANGYATAYGHLSRFASGIHAGTRVRQGQIVAYSGMTGLATGPHLHYEIRVNNAQVNPATVKVASGRTLEGEELRSFFSERAHIDTLVASVPMQSKLAQATGLRELRTR